MSQISYKERERIQVLLELKYSHKKIAKILWKGNKAVSEEIKRNSINWKYIAEIAEIIRRTKRWLVNSLIHCRIPRWSPLDKYIL